MNPNGTARVDTTSGSPARLNNVRWACARATGSHGRDSQTARRRLQEALTVVPAQARPDLRLPLMLELVEDDAPMAALARIDEIGELAEALGMANVRLGAHLRAADIAATCDASRARPEALAAIALRARGLQTTAILPAGFRHGFLERNPVDRALLGWRATDWRASAAIDSLDRTADPLTTTGWRTTA